MARLHVSSVDVDGACCAIALFTVVLDLEKIMAKKYNANTADDKAKRAGLGRLEYLLSTNSRTVSHVRSGRPWTFVSVFKDYR